MCPTIAFLPGHLFTDADVGVTNITVTTSDHGALAGLGDDDHGQYYLANGTRVLTGALDHDGSTAGFFAATPVVKQTSGANLTNNVTSGGTDDTIANYTDLTTYANDAAAIRNDIYQLARKLKQVNDAMRLYGLLT